MPELKNLFVQGKMNKDLDERLVPQGEYRDANNIDVSYSDGSNVGAIEPITGTVSVGVYTFDLTDAHCVGSVVDTENDKFYGLIYSPTVNLIVEYGTRDTPDARQVVLADTGSVLNFDPTRLITGINILDGILYFTDNYSEPKQVDIEYWKNLNNVSATVASGTAGNTTITLNEDISTKLQSLLDGGDNTVYVYGSGITQHATVTSISGTTLVVSSVSSTSAPGGTLMFSTLYTTPGLSEDRITVIKKSPLSAPTFNTLEPSLRGGNGTIGNTACTTSTINFSTININGSVTGLVISTDGTASGNFANYQQDDIISLTYTYTDQYGVVQESIARIEITETYSGSKTVDGILLTKTNNIINDTVSYTALLEEDDPLFELKFAKFAYRYKYTNGQYSSMSPFSLPAFIPGDYSYTAKEGFNTGMVNTVRQIILEGWITSPSSANYEADIETIEVLYKDSISSNIYIVDEVNKGQRIYAGDGTTTEFEVLNTDFNGDAPDTESGIEVYVNNVLIDNTNYTYPDTNPPLVVQGNKLTFTGNTGNTNELESSGAPKDGLEVKIIGVNFASTLEVKDEQIFKAIESNQLLRPFDSVPRKAKAQEVIANRLIYGNYQQNFNFIGTPIFTVNTGTRTDSLGQNLSLKSGRTYQIGITFKDEYGRETPVFTDKSGVIKIPYKNADLKQDFRVSTTVTPPAEATHYKYYIKEPSNPYYNIAASNLYEDKETGHLYLSFPSSEVNKVSEDDVLVLKKGTGDSPYKLTDKKFKVLSKLNDPPDFLAYKNEVVYSTNYLEFDTQYGQGDEWTTKSPGRTPVPGHNTIVIEKAGRTSDDVSPNEVDSGFRDAITVGSEIRFRRSGTNSYSKLYKITSILYHPTGEYEAEITFEKPFGDDVNVIYVDDTDTSEYLATIEKIERVSDVGNPEYDGKFFLKLNNKTLLKQALFEATDESSLSTVATNFYITMQEDDADGTDDWKEYWVAAVASANSTLGAITSISGDTVNIPAGFHIVLGTEENWNDANSNYSEDPFNAALVVGNYLRFFGNSAFDSGYDSVSEHPNFKITEIDRGDFGLQRYWAIKFDENMPYTFPSGNVDIGIDVRTFAADGGETPTNPPIFEVEPEEGPLEIYYETENAYPIADLSSTKTLSYANCFTFENGVESDRIRDDYNAPTLGKGVRVSTTFEDNYQEETLKSGLIFSQIYNSKNGINRLNQFIIAEDITKDLNPEYGAIQKLHTRDTDLIALCEDKVLRVLANKDALFNADGNVNITSNAAVLGQAIPFAGEYGISKNPESFASYTYRAYFTDKNRGKVLRLSLDGLTEISNYGMKDYFKDIFYSHNGFMHGSYDAKKDQYNLSIRGYESDNLNKSGIDETISYSEDVRGWVSKKDWIQEAGGSINNQYFTFYGGHADFHHNSGSSTLHGSAYKSDITFLLNGNPGNIKNFRTINYHGGSGWEVDSITTDKQSGSIDGATRDPETGFIYKWREKEGIYYNYISGITENTKSNLDLKSLNVQGLGTPTGISGNDATFADLNNAIQVGDKVFNNSNSTVRTVTAISGNTITLDGAPENAFNFFSKDNKFNTSGVLGYYAEIKMETTNNISSSNRPELYSVGSEVSLSS